MEVIGQINIDFYILETGSPNILSIYDNSDWLYSENLPSYLVITLPGSKKQKTYTFKKNAVNTLNSHNLGLSCLKGDCTEEEYVALPDGVYTITLKSGYEDIEETKYYLKTDSFDIDFAEQVIKNKENNDPVYIQSMTQLKWIENIAKNEAKLGDFVESNRFFKEAQDILNKYKECHNCK